MNEKTQVIIDKIIKDCEEFNRDELLSFIESLTHFAVDSSDIENITKGMTNKKHQPQMTSVLLHFLLINLDTREKSVRKKEAEIEEAKDQDPLGIANLNIKPRF